MKKIVILTSLCGGLLLTTFEGLHAQECFPESAFENCTKLKSVYLPANIEEIGALSFSGCTTLTELVLPNPAPNNYGKAAFPDQSGLVIYVPTDADKTKIEELFLFNHTIVRVGKPSSANESRILGHGLRFCIGEQTLTITSDLDFPDIRICRLNGEPAAFVRITAGGTTSILLPEGVYAVSAGKETIKIQID